MRFGRLMVRVLVVAALALGIVVMHHVAVPQDDDAAAAHHAAAAAHPGGAADDGAEHSGTGDGAPAGHGWLHLCLAALTAAALLVVGWLLVAWLRAWRTVRPSRPVRAWRAPARSPPRPHGSALLVSLCVMRT